MSVTNDDIQNYIQLIEYKKKYGYYPTDNSNTNFRKTEYRSEEHEKLKLINRVINIIYYAFLILLFMLLYTNNTLNLKERYPLYIFLLIFPYLYPWLWMLFNKLLNLIMPSEYTGPKNAFIDKSKEKQLLNI